MEKISSVLPSNARTRTVDLSRSQPVRPGAPTWGRSEGKVTTTEIEDKVSLSATPRLPENPAVYKNPVDAVKLRAANEVAQKFFDSKQAQNLAKESGQTLSEDMLDRAPAPQLPAKVSAPDPRSAASSFSSVNPVSSKEEIE